MKHVLNALFCICVISGLLTGCAQVAQIVYPLNTKAMEAKPGDYTLDNGHTSVIFAVSHLGFSTFYGRFNEISGTLRLDTETPENSQIEVFIQAASIDTGVPALDEKLIAPSVFDTTTYPDIHFISSQVRPLGEGKAEITGQLTIKDKTYPLVLEASFLGSGTIPVTNKEAVGFDVKANLLRSDYGLTEWIPFVSNEVQLTISAEFNR